jgi:2-methylcitrate dehydratase PrpD
VTDSIVYALSQMMVSARDRGVPAQVSASVRQRILDILGICVAASPLPTSAAVRRFARAHGGPAEATAVGMGGQVPATWAALVNGTLAHSLDFDDTHLPSVVHPSATIVPTCLAAGQLARVPGRQVVAAAAAGLEACVRLGMAGYDQRAGTSTYFEKGFHATSICGAIAGAGAAASLLGIDVEGIANAMSVGASMAGGLIEANRGGGTVKRIHCGWAAHAAVSAARLAEMGITGPASIIEGHFGFLRAYLGDTYDASAITVGLGEEWLVPGINFKPYPANHFTHAGIDAAMALRERGLQPEKIRSLTLGVAAQVLPTIGTPIEVKRNPRTGYEAQFSGPYTVAAGLLGGHGLGLGLADFTDELAVSPERKALMARISVVEDRDCSKVFPHEFAATLRCETTSGEVLAERVMISRGGARRPLSDEEILAKFTDNAHGVLGESEIAAVREACEAVEQLDDVSECLRPLAQDLTSEIPAYGASPAAARSA